MTHLKQFDRPTLRTFNTEIMQAVALIGQKYGVLIEQDGNGRFTPTEYRLRLKATIPTGTATGTAATASETTVAGKSFPPGAPLTDADIGALVTFGKDQYRIDGYNSAKRVKCVSLTRVRDKRPGYCSSYDDVVAALGRVATATTGDKVYPGDWGMLPGEDVNKYLARTQAMLDAIPRDKIIRFPRGDGYALYFVASLHPLRLQHIPYGDAWEADPLILRRLQASDVEAMLDREKRLNSLFARR